MSYINKLCNIEEIFYENKDLTPVTPNDPVDLWPHNKGRGYIDVEVEGVKLMYVYIHESYGQAVQYGWVRAYLVKMTIWSL